MNGAEALIRVLEEAGVTVCFANPGTSEMHLVAAIDRSERMWPVLCLHENVATGAADGYGRMARRPAATLLHLGPGLANGMSNLHNARRARTPVVNIVGDHAQTHLALDAPLTSDITAMAATVSDWVRTSESPDRLAGDGAAALAASMEENGKIATLIVPADCAWEDAPESMPASPAAPAAPWSSSETDEIIAALRSGEPSALFLGGGALSGEALEYAARIAAATDAQLICETFPARIQRGHGRPKLDRLPYFGEMAADRLKDIRHLILVGAKAPVSFFAYPGKPGRLTPEAAKVHTLASPREDALTALRTLAERLDAPQGHDLAQPSAIPDAPAGKLDVIGLGAVIAELMPENAVVSDESATAGAFIYPMTDGARPHDWLTLTGGSIGQGLPVAAGAAIACPDRKVLSLQADGSAMYTLQALWTMARERLDVTTVIINNGSYAILNIELMRVGVENPGPKALSMLDLTNPPIGWTALAEGLVVPARRADTVEEFRSALTEALAVKGPALVEAVL